MIRSRNRKCSIFFFLLQRLQTAAEAAVTAYEYNSSLTLADIEYLNVNEVKNMTLEYDPHFGQEVFEEESGVHIPIEIYEGCEYTCVLSSSLTLVQVWALIVGGHVHVQSIKGAFICSILVDVRAVSKPPMQHM